MKPPSRPYRSLGPSRGPRRPRRSAPAWSVDAPGPAGVPLPDLLYPRPTARVDERLLEELLELSFLGREAGADLSEVLETVELPDSPWRSEFFAEGLFLDELLDRCFTVSLHGRRFPLHRRFLRTVLGRPPVDPQVVRHRQAILAELEEDGEVRRRAEDLYVALFDLLSLFKAPGGGNLGGVDPDHASFRLEILRQVERVVTLLAEGFAGCRSGLVRLSEVAVDVRESREYRLLDALLEHEEHLAELAVQVRVGADGRIRSLAVQGVVENEENHFHRGPLRRWLDRLKLRWGGFDLDRREVVNRLIVAVYQEIAPALRSLLQLIGHLEVYLGALAFADAARSHGLEVCRAEILPAPSDPEGGPDDRLELDALFNPLLLREGHVIPIPCRIAPRHRSPSLVVTGPNSGGKTRMLQAVGVAQLLGQAGLYVPARRARLPLARGLFVSLIEHATADETEGRLGAELRRIRRLFEEIRPGSLILLDELCSGTNPSEAVEIVALVLDLLQGLRPTAFVTTHFLDYARGLAADPPYPELEVLRVVTSPDHVPTYQFAPGVAATSLAADTARRMGVTFEDLADLLAARFQVEGPRRGG